VERVTAARDATTGLRTAMGRVELVVATVDRTVGEADTLAVAVTAARAGVELVEPVT